MDLRIWESICNNWGIETFKEIRSFVVLFIEGFDSYVPWLGVKEMDNPLMCYLTMFRVWVSTLRGRTRLNAIWSGKRILSGNCNNRRNKIRWGNKPYWRREFYRGFYGVGEINSAGELNSYKLCWGNNPRWGWVCDDSSAGILRVAETLFQFLGSLVNAYSCFYAHIC